MVSAGDGVLSWDAALGHMERLSQDPQFDPAFSQLMDFRGVTRVDLSHDQIYELAQRRVFSDGARRAIVAPSPVQFGLARMFQSYSLARGARGIQIFPEMGEAVAWLNLAAARAEGEPDPHRPI